MNKVPKAKQARKDLLALLVLKVSKANKVFRVNKDLEAQQDRKDLKVTKAIRVQKANKD